MIAAQLHLRKVIIFVLFFITAQMGMAQNTIQLGSGTNTTGNTSASPVNTYYQSARMHLLYKANELNNQGIYGYSKITDLGFYIADPPDYPLSNFKVRVKLVDTDDLTAVGSSGFYQVYGTASYQPTQTGFDTISLDTAFWWDGSRNLVVDVCYEGLSSTGSGGTVRTYYGYNQYSYVRDNNASQCSASPTTFSSQKPQLLLTFEPDSTLDASLSAFFAPEKPFASGNQSVQVILQNVGLNENLTSADINWTVNGESQSPYSWNGNLEVNESDTVNIGNYTFDHDSVYNMEIIVDAPGDPLHGNDTLRAAGLRTAMDGNYTIGPAGADFLTFTEAVNALDSGGILGNVVFNIDDNTYFEQLTIPEIAGTSPANTITFQSSSGDSTSVLLSHASGYNQNYTVWIKGADYLTFKNMGFEATNNTYGRVILISGGSTNLRFENNRFLGVNTGSTYSSRAVIYDMDVSLNDDSSYFINNLIENGSYGIHYEGLSSYDMDYGLTITGNELINQSRKGIEVNFYKDVVIRNNRIETNTASNSFTGIELNYLDSTFYIGQNHIFIPTDGEGLSIYNSDAHDTSRGQVVNNFISLGHDDNAFGIYNNRSSAIEYFHNSILVSSTDPDYSRSFYDYNGSEITLYNNIFANTGGGQAMYFNSLNALDTSDHNNVYATGEVLVYAESDYLHLTDWQDATSQDSHSFNVDPLFFSDKDLHTVQISFNGKGSPVGISEDIDGESRNTGNPDIGADEFDPPSIDAGLVGMYPAEPPFPSGSNEVYAVIKNFGSTNLTSATIHWKINDSTLTAYSWSGDLPSNTEDSVNIGSYSFEAGTAYDLTFWSSNPNGGSDPQTLNDTMKTPGLYAALSGTYHIGGSSPDYSTLSEAVDDLNNGGVVDAVLFNIRSGTYSEQVAVSDFPVDESYSGVTFASESGDTSSVRIKAGNTYADRYVMKLDGADHITIEHLTLEAEDEYYARVLEISGGANNNHILNNHIVGPATTSASSYKALIYSAYGSGIEDRDSGNVISGNHFQGGSQAIYWQGYSSSPDTWESGNRFSNNHFSNQFQKALYLVYQKKPVVSNNHIETTSGHHDFFGIHLSHVYSNSTITENSIYLENSGYGMYFDDTDGEADYNALISNNFISVGGSEPSYGLYFYSSRNYKVLYNNILLRTTEVNSSSGIYQRYGAGVEYVNNISANMGGGYTFHFDDLSDINRSDHNNWYTTGSILGRYEGTDVSGLDQWISETALDSNSYMLDPLYFSDQDLHIKEFALFDGGIAIPEVDEDFDGQIRNTATPTIGADEVTPPATDAGIAELVSPVVPFKHGSQPLSVMLRNYGTDPLTSANIIYSINGTQSTYAWSGSLPSGDTTFVELGNQSFDLGKKYNIVVWSENPNGSADPLNSNDTIRMPDTYPGFSGTYTIGGTAPDFVDFTAAVTVLNQGGAIDSAVFEVRPGTYNEQLSIKEFPGAHCNVPVIFRSESMDTSDVHLVYSASADSNYTLQLKGAKGIVFESMTIKALHKDYSRIIDIRQNASCNILTNNRLLGATTSGSYDRQAIIYSPGGSSSKDNDSLNHFINNTIENGTFGMHYRGYSDGSEALESGTVIRNNQFINQAYQGLRIENQTNIEITGNRFETDSIRTDYTAIDADDLNFGARINENDIYVPAGSYGIQLYSSSASASDPTWIANNFITVGGDDYSYALYCRYSEYVNVFFNNILMTPTTGSNSYGLYFYSGNSLKLLNNNIINEGQGYVVYTSSTYALTQSDHNNFLTNGNYLVYWSGNQPTLADWQNASTMDQNSYAVDPLYTNLDDLHTNSALINNQGKQINDITTDIDGDTRQSPPDIGADEYTPTGENAVLAALEYPEPPFQPGSYDIKAIISNSSAQALKQLTIDWQINGTDQSAYYWSDSLNTNEKDTILLGSHDFQYGTGYSIKAWISNPNGNTDIDPSNDTMAIERLYTALEGTYTIGGSSPDFDSLYQAVEYLEKGGAYDTIWFKIRPGIYEEQLSIHAFPGDTCQVPVIFESSTGDSADVTIAYQGTYNNNYTIQLDGAQGVAFRNLSLKALHSSYGRIVSLINGASCNHFEGNHFLGIQTTSNSTNQAIIYSPNGSSSQDLDNHNVFAGNVFRNGSYGFYLRGYNSSPGNRESGLRLEGNKLMDQSHMGIALHYQETATILGNEIINDADEGYKGIFFNFVYGNTRIERNYINISRGRYGIHYNRVYGSAVQPAIIANNFIIIEGDDYAHGIELSSSDYIQAVFNSILINSSHVDRGRAFSIYYSDDLEVYNNIFANKGGGYAIYNNAGGNFGASDYNNLYTTGENLGYWSRSDQADLGQWQSSSGKDLNSFSVDPGFVSNSNLHASNITLDGNAINVPGITEDYDGQTRNPSGADIGADEFTTYTADAGAIDLIEPISPFAAGENEVTVKLLNNANEKLDSVDIYWKVNDSLQVYPWTGDLAPGNDINVSLGTFNFVAGNSYTLSAWTQLPNGKNDQNTENDTLPATALNVGIIGDYTIGGTNGDYHSFNKAVQALVEGGVVGPVNFSVHDSTYFEQVSIPPIQGASDSNRITFASASGDSAGVVMTFAASSGDNYTLQLDGADYITFREMTLKATNTSYARVIDIRNEARYNLFENLYIEGISDNHYGTNQTLVFSPAQSAGVNNIFRNSQFRFGTYAFHYSGSYNQYESGTHIIGNLFTDQTVKGIYLDRHQDLVLSKNIIKSHSDNYIGVHLDHASDHYEITGNQLYLQNSDYGIYVDYSEAGSGNRGLLANNVISISGPDQVYGIYLYASSQLDLYFNSVNLYGSAGQTRALYINGGSSNRLMNNILSNHAGGYALYNANDNAVSGSDFNNYYTSGNVLSYWEAERIDLAALQNASQQDQNALSYNPLFNSATDLHTNQVALNGKGDPVTGITHDFEGDPREATPDIGADEFDSRAKDIGITHIFPASACNIGSSVPLRVTVQNYGSQAQSGFEVALVLGSRDTLVENTGTLTVEPGDSAVYTFSQRYDFSKDDTTYRVSAYTLLQDDEFRHNDTLPATVTNYPSPNISLTPDMAVCAGEKVNLSARGGQTYHWSNGQSGSIIQVQPADTTLYTVTVSNATGCSAQDSVRIDVRPRPEKPEISLESISDTVCSGIAVKLSTQYQEGISWYAGQRNPENYLDTGKIYHARESNDLLATYTNAFGCSATSDPYTVTVLPSPSITATPSTSICAGDTVELQVEDASSYTWSTGDTVSSIKMAPQTDTVIYVSASNELSCVYNDSVTLNVLPSTPPTMVSNMLPSDSSLNLEQPVKFSWQPAENAVHYDFYLWESTDAAPSQPTDKGLEKISIRKDQLDPQVYYNWRVDARNSCYTSVGDTQSLTVSGKPDLYITDFTVQEEVVGGGKINVSWEVANKGQGSTVNAQWKDYIWLSTDADLRAGDDHQLAAFDNQTFLKPGDSYKQIKEIEVPETISGIYYIFITTDNDDAYCKGTFQGDTCDGERGHHRSSIDELDEQNNYRYDTLTVQLPPLPDLEVTSVGVPTNVFSGDKIEMIYEVKNFGDKNAKGQFTRIFSSIMPNCAGKTMQDCICLFPWDFWKDAFYISEESTFNPQTAHKLTEHEVFLGYIGSCQAWNDRLEIDSSYRRNISLTIPHQYSGTYYIYAVSNSLGVKEAFVNNNIKRSAPIQVTLTPPANLKVTNMQIPSSSPSGERIDIRWMVENKGANPPVENQWVDRIYLSETDTLDRSSAILLGQVAHSEGSSLDAGDMYTASLEAELPVAREGYYYVFLETDARKEVFEYDMEADNVARSATPIQLYIGDLPDLAVTGMQAPDSVERGGTFVISWTVENKGNKPITEDWTDHIYYSADTSYQTGILHKLKTKSITASLSPGQAISHQARIEAPTGLPDHINFFVLTDGSDNLYEEDENNNVGYHQKYQSPGESGYVRTYSPPAPDRQYADLRIDDAVMPRAMTTGYTYEAVWEASNQGEGAPSSVSWKDGLYLSKDSTLDPNDFYLANQGRRGGLEPTATYTNSANFTVPQGIDGKYHLILNLDVYLNVKNENDRENQQRIIPVNITQSASPDLTVDAFNPPSVILAGETMNVRFATANQGDTIAMADPQYRPKRNWINQIYLSTTKDLSGEETIKIGSKRQFDPIDKGSVYLDSIEIEIPVTYSGNYYLVIVVDQGNKIYEQGGEHNNLIARAVTVQTPDPADLILTDMHLDPQVTLGDEMEVRYTVQNTGTNPALGSLKDAVYISQNDTFETVSDYLLGTSQRSVRINPGESLSGSVTDPVKTLDPGDYYGIGKTNILNTISETNRTNNVFVSDDRVSVNVQELELGKTVNTKISKNQSLYYQVTVASGKDLLINLNSQLSNNGVNTVYVAHNRVPAPGDYDAKSNDPRSLDQQVLIPSTRAGSYYILIETTYEPLLVNQLPQPQGISIRAESLPFTMLGASPERVGQGIVTTTINGAGFRQGMEVYMVEGSDTLATGNVLKLKTSMEALVRWELASVEQGTFDLLAINPDNEEVIKDNAIVVEESTGLRLNYVPLTPNVVRIDKSGYFGFYFKNAGNVDIPITQINISMLKENRLLKLNTEGNVRTRSEFDPYGRMGHLKDYVENDRFKILPLISKDLRVGEEFSVVLLLENFVTNPHGMKLDMGTFSIRQFLQQQKCLIEDARRWHIFNPELEEDAKHIAHDPVRFRDTIMQTYFDMDILEPSDTAGFPWESIKCRPSVNYINTENFTYSPGGSPGTSDHPSITLEQGGDLLWEINNTSRAAGKDPGWDLLKANTELYITSTATDPFRIKMVSLNERNIPGDLNGWDPSVPHSWPVMVAEEGIYGFDQDKFKLDYSDFANYNELYGGSFSVVLNGTDTLNVHYSPGSAGASGGGTSGDGGDSGGDGDGSDSGGSGDDDGSGGGGGSGGGSGDDDGGSGDDDSDGDDDGGDDDGDDGNNGDDDNGGDDNDGDDNDGDDNDGDDNDGDDNDGGDNGGGDNGGGDDNGDGSDDGPTPPNPPGAGCVQGDGGAQVTPEEAKDCQLAFAALGCASAYFTCAGAPVACATGVLCPFAVGGCLLSTFACTYGVTSYFTDAPPEPGYVGCLGVIDAALCITSEIACTPTVGSCDPNEIDGPDGYGPENFVARDQRLPYTIYFENDAKLASAAAQKVTIRQKADPDLNANSFRLNDFGFGDFVFTVPENTAHYTQTLQLEDSIGYNVQVTAGLDVVNDELFWVFQTVDPQTGLSPEEPFAGFLPVNDSTHAGEGFVSYSVIPSETSQTGDTITASAEIIFDKNEPIVTNTATNLIDAVAPESTVEAVPQVVNKKEITLSVQAEDDPTGSGVQSYDIYISENGADYRGIASIQDQQTHMLQLETGYTYAVYAQARDHVNNVEPVKDTFDIQFTAGEVEAVKPAIAEFSPDSAYQDEKITITGERFNEVSQVTFNGIAASFNVNSSREIEAAVPAQASTGPVGVTTVSGRAVSQQQFKRLMCNKPYDLITLLSDSSVLMQWNTLNNFDQIDLKYAKLSDDSWNKVGLDSSSFEFMDPQEVTRYKWTVRTVCDDQNDRASAWADIRTFVYASDPGQDTDGDSIADRNDNCPKIANTNQADQDQDGFGDSCDICPEYPNPEQKLPVWYIDADGDGYGDSTSPEESCTQPAGYVDRPGDCNDNDSAVNPETLWYADQDGDGYGNPGNYQSSCQQPEGYVSNALDCNDTDDALHPDAIEIADGKDNNCDGRIDNDLMMDVSITADRSEICEGQNMHFDAAVQNGGEQPEYTWLINGQKAGGNGASLSTNTLHDGDRIHVRIVADSTVDVKTDTLFSDTLEIAVNPNPEPQITKTENTLTSTEAASYQWYRDDEALDATSGSITTTQPGLYHVEVTSQYGCVAASDKVRVEPTDLENQVERFNIRVYPVPADKRIFVDLGEAVRENATLTIATVDGTTMQVDQLKPDNLKQVVELDVSGLSSGNYILNIRIGAMQSNHVIQVE